MLDGREPLWAPVSFLPGIGVNALADAWSLLDIDLAPGMDGKSEALFNEGEFVCAFWFFLAQALATAYGAGRLPPPSDGKLSANKLAC